MNTESLRTFLVLAEVKNFRKAAQQLYVVQSTVSSRIQELESELGQKLFERTNRALTLTPAGNRLIPYAENMLDLEKNILENVSRYDSYMRTLNIGISDSIFYAYIQPLIPDFLADHPEISLNFISQNSSVMLNKLQDDQLDICISFIPNYDKSYETFLLADEELVLATGSQNTDFSQGATIEDLLGLQIYVSQFFNINREIEQWYFNIFPTSFHYRFQTDVIWNLTHMLKHGNGYALIPRGFIKNELKDHTLIIIPLKFPAPPRIKMYVVIKKGKRKLHKVQCFLDTIGHLIQETAK